MVLGCEVESCQLRCGVGVCISATFSRVSWKAMSREMVLSTPSLKTQSVCSSKSVINRLGAFTWAQTIDGRIRARVSKNLFADHQNGEFVEHI